MIFGSPAKWCSCPRTVSGQSRIGRFELLLPARRQAGFSLTELLVALLVAMILLAVALPMAVRAYRSYKLTDAADNVAETLRFTRYEAIRLNKPANFGVSVGAPPGMTSIWADVNSNGQWDATEKGAVLGEQGNLVSGAPGVSALMAASKIGSMPTQTWPAMPTLVFDQRGAVNPPTNVNVFYLSAAAAPDAGYRAVLLMPAGAIQVWSSDSSGNWQKQR